MSEKWIKWEEREQREGLQGAERENGHAFCYSHASMSEGMREGESYPGKHGVLIGPCPSFKATLSHMTLFPTSLL